MASKCHSNEDIEGLDKVVKFRKLNNQCRSSSNSSADGMMFDNSNLLGPNKVNSSSNQRISLKNQLKL